MGRFPGPARTSNHSTGGSLGRRSFRPVRIVRSRRPRRGVLESRVYFDGVPRRRREIVPTLAHTPGMTEKAARLLLATAPVAGKEPAAKPPAAWFHSIPAIATPGESHLDDDDDLDEDDLDDEGDDGLDDDLADDLPAKPAPIIG